MRDMGRSDDPRVQAQLDRLGTLSIQRDTLGLDAIRELLHRLGDPHKRLPQTFHVAGTNGKGSTCAFLRAMLEAEGYSVHVTTSPHLVRYNERFRVAGKLIEDARLAELLEEVFDAAEGLGCSFFEITIAAAFVEFARVPADACVVEVGLGGRLDATNVLEPDVLAACGIAALGIDHEKFLLAPEEGAPKEPMARIAWEKAGIAKKGVPLVTFEHAEPEFETPMIHWPGKPPEIDYERLDSEEFDPVVNPAIEETAESVGAPLYQTVGEKWWGIHSVKERNDRLRYADHQNHGGKLESFVLPLPALGGVHQISNAGLAIAMLRHQDKVKVSISSVRNGLKEARWPARLQCLTSGPLTTLVSQNVWLDGGHNRSAGWAISDTLDTPLHLILGMIEGKDPRALLDPLGDRVRSLHVVQIPGHPSHPAEAFGPEAIAKDSIEDALLSIPSDDYPILIAGSLYLAGEVLRLNDEIPD